MELIWKPRELVEKSTEARNRASAKRLFIFSTFCTLRTSTWTAFIAVGFFGVEPEQLQLQLSLGSMGALLRYGLISREKRNYPESQSVGSVRRIISPWNCGRVVFPSCRLSEQSAFLTLGAERVTGTGAELQEVNAKMSCSSQLWLGWRWEKKPAVCMLAV